MNLEKNSVVLKFLKKFHEKSIFWRKLKKNKTFIWAGKKSAKEGGGFEGWKLIMNKNSFC